MSRLPWDVHLAMRELLAVVTTADPPKEMKSVQRIAKDLQKSMEAHYVQLEFGATAINETRARLLAEARKVELKRDQELLIATLDSAKTISELFRFEKLPRVAAGWSWIQQEQAILERKRNICDQLDIELGEVERIRKKLRQDVETATQVPQKHRQSSSEVQETSTQTPALQP